MSALATSSVRLGGRAPRRRKNQRATSGTEPTRICTAASAAEAAGATGVLRGDGRGDRLLDRRAGQGRVEPHTFCRGAVAVGAAVGELCGRGGDCARRRAPLDRRWALPWPALSAGGIGGVMDGGRGWRRPATKTTAMSATSRIWRMGVSLQASGVWYRPRHGQQGRWGRGPGPASGGSVAQTNGRCVKRSRRAQPKQSPRASSRSAGDGKLRALPWLARRVGGSRLADLDDAAIKIC
jgi:hypothetical protein